ncbi:DNA topoisomerase type IA zn finger domain-containing protein [Raoultella ornithinolytica]|nr:DNA topoisomerase type IA zn finger domain-containing protein [Raoultella ornithinolytica]
MTKSALFSVRKNEPCPQCGAELVIRSGKHGPFLGCSHYPDCDYVRPLKNQADGHIVKVLEGQECPSCGAVMVLRQGRFGMFIGCSRYPECEHTETIDKPDETAISCPPVWARAAGSAPFSFRQNLSFLRSLPRLPVRYQLQTGSG